MTRLTAALQGNLREMMAAETKEAAEAVSAAAATAGAALKQSLRSQVEGAGLGKLGKAWSLRTYPKAPSMGAAALVYPKGGPRTLGAMQAFAAGVTIASSKGLFIAVPTPEAPERGEGNQRIAPSNWPVARFGPLRFVTSRAGLHMLVADGLRITPAGRLRQNQGRRQGAPFTRLSGTLSVVMFWLVPKVTLRKRFDIDAAAAAAIDLMAAEIISNWSGD